MKLTTILTLLFLCLLCAGCSNLKYLEEDEQLYVGGEVSAEGENTSGSTENRLERNMEDLLRPEPNSSFLGLRFKLYLYNIAGDPEGEGFWNWVKNDLGEPPVLFEEVDLEYNEDFLKSYAGNKGFFLASVTSDTVVKNKKVTAKYDVQLGERYHIREVHFPEDTTALHKDIVSTKDNSFLIPGKPYDLDAIVSERERIDSYLKEKGYFYFRPEYLLARVDSTVGEKEVDIHLLVKKETPEQAKETYSIGDVFVYADYSIARDTVKPTEENSIQYEDLTIIDPERKFKPKLFERSLLFESGDVYSRNNHNKSVNRLLNLGIFKFVKNDFRLTDSINNTLDAYYYLTPTSKKFLRAELLGKTNSADYAGSELNLSWSNRNTFRGAELLQISLLGGFEVQVSGSGPANNVFRIGTETSLTWPKFVLPFRYSHESPYVPRTKALISYEFQNRTELYSLNSFKSTFGYLWKTDLKNEHHLRVLDAAFVSPMKITPLYEEQTLANPALGRVTEEQLILGSSYTYTFTNTMEDKKHNFYFRGNSELSGNIIGLVTGADAEAGDQKNIFNVPFSQFVKLDVDFRHYLSLSRQADLASRIIVGAGIPYGNSREIPFSRQFFVGGTNSIRAFQARTLGPGSFNPESIQTTFLPDQSGDLKLELNTEYRHDLFSILEGAVFVDAGNIWLLNENEDKPGAKFSSDFLKEIAVGTGVGLRFDLSLLIIRADLAFPLRKPYLPEGDRWVLDRINFGSSNWRSDNLVLNIAIGYPF